MKGGLKQVAAGAVALAVTIGVTASAAAQPPAPVGEWRAFGADPANTKYSPLDQITPENFTELEVAWRWRSLSAEVAESHEAIRPGPFKTAPLMIGGLVYASTALGQVAALDAGTGELVWSYDPRTYDRLERPANMGWQHRGVSYWEDEASGDARIFIATHDLLLVAMNARNGRLYPDFGADGAVDLSGSLGRPIDRSRLTHSQPLAVVGDTVIVGSIVQDGSLTRREADPGHVRAFDARTGEMKWIFHTIPQGEEFGAETWQNESWRYSGHTNVWGTMAVDEELGYVYLPTGTPTNDWYGGMRPGDNLFAESIVAVDVETGQRVWHFQAVHHGLWDYDFPTAGNLVDIRVDGRDVKAIAQPSKQAFLYVFDRVTGEPVWPIEERPVPAGSVPGEWYSPTQPFPTRPAAFDLQGITVDDLIDFTPELRDEALRIAERAQLGPIFTPPPVRGEGRPIIQSPGPGGGINWPGAAADPETGRLFVPSQTRLRAVELVEYPPPRHRRLLHRPLGAAGAGTPGAAPRQAALQAGHRHRPHYRRPRLDEPPRGRTAQPSGAARPRSAAPRRPQRHARGRPVGDEEPADRQLRRPVRRGHGRGGARDHGLRQGHRGLSGVGAAARRSLRQSRHLPVRGEAVHRRGRRHVERGRRGGADCAGLAVTGGSGAAPRADEFVGRGSADREREARRLRRGGSRSGSGSRAGATRRVPLRNSGTASWAGATHRPSRFATSSSSFRAACFALL